jgi:mono/diheme cytochrome c family protein
MRAANTPALLILILGTLRACPASAEELGDAERGRAYAQRVCAECHAVLPSELISPSPGVATFKVIANTPGMMPTALEVWFQTSHPTMPNLIIAPEDRDDVIAYILSLRDGR